MKKSLPPSRRRALTEEERALWHAVAKTATPLRRRRKLHAEDEGETPRAADADHHHAQPVARQQVTPAARTATPALAPLGRRERSKLAKGHTEIDARIDLHGMTQERAHRRLIAFLHRARDDGATFVLVITGKGRASDSGRGVLRQQVPHWLSLPDLRSLVVGFEQAHIGHGGEGALYVRLRRAR